MFDHMEKFFGVTWLRPRPL